MDVNFTILDSNPRIDHLARTYTDVPTDAERIRIKKIILDAEFDISRLDAEIYNTPDDIDVTQQISTLRTRVDFYKAIIAPVRCIPPEILGEIFIYLKTPPPDFCFGSVSKGPLLLSSHVCSHWRAVAAGLPWLWNAIEIVPRRTQQADLTPTLLETWLRQAKSLPLSISLEGSLITPQITDLVNSRAVAFQHTSCFEIPMTLYSSLFNGPSSSMTRLETVIIHFSAERWKNDEVFRGLDASFEYAPCLCHVELHGPLFDMNTLRIPWSQLTFLYLQRVWLPLDITPFIHDLANLETFTLDAQYRGTSSSDFCSEPAFPMTTLPSLRCLDLRFWDNATLTSELFDCVTLPALEEFRLEFVVGGVFPHANFISMHDRSGFDLKKLTISSVEMGSVSQARELLGRMSSLLSFDTKEDPNCRAGMRRALIYNSKRPLLSLLQEVRFHGDPPRLTFEETFTNVVASRWWPDNMPDDSSGRLPQRLTSAYLRLTGRHMNDIIKTRLLEFKAEGLRLEIVEDIDILVPEDDLHGDGSDEEG